MNILDIDQDFFFSPVISGYLNNITKTNQTMVENFDRLISKIVLNIDDNTEFFCFDTHDRVGELILAKNFKNITLYHLDAHQDKDIKHGKMNECNWISYIEDRCDHIYWIINDKQIESKKTFSLKFIEFNHIDVITWTKSPLWCPQHIDLFSMFLNQLINYSKTINISKI